MRMKKNYEQIATLKKIEGPNKNYNIGEIKNIIYLNIYHLTLKE